MGLHLGLWRNRDCSRRLKHRPGYRQFLCQIGGQPFYAGRAFTGHETNSFVTDSQVSEVCAHDSIALTSFSPGGRIKSSVKSYVWSITDRSWPSGKPDECASARARAIARDEGGYTPFAYVIPDLQAGTYAAAIAQERDNHLLIGMAGSDWIDLIRLLFEGFEIVVIDLADHINKHSALTIRFMDHDSRSHAPFGKHDYYGSNQSRFQRLAHDFKYYHMATVSATQSGGLVRDCRQTSFPGRAAKTFAPMRRIRSGCCARAASGTPRPCYRPLQRSPAALCRPWDFLRPIDPTGRMSAPLGEELGWNVCPE